MYVVCLNSPELQIIYWRCWLSLLKGQSFVKLYCCDNRLWLCVLHFWVGFCQMGKHNNSFEWLQKNLYILYIFVCDILYISIIRVDALNLLNWIRMCFSVSRGQKIKKYVLYTHTKKLYTKCQFRTVSIMQCYIWRGAILTIFSTRRTSGLSLLLCCCHHCCSLWHSMEQYYEMYEMTKILKDKWRIHTVYY